MTAILALLLCGCSKKNSDAGGSSTSGSSAASASSATGDGTTAITGQGDADAVKAVSDELANHWLKVPDGWISEYPSQTYIATGKRASAESFYREMKALKFYVNADDLSPSDKLNGVQFDGTCQFDPAPTRVFGDPNAFGPKRWSDWHDSSESVRVQKRNGQWTFASNLGYLLEGAKPGADVAAQLK
ncbi:MAG TPA: hypothetical protein VLI90_01190 [Tepidisphaeraceae bacterium]|nr:hypothetical protein [Tepidisphaeraceae bacterium]